MKSLSNKLVKNLRVLLFTAIAAVVFLPVKTDAQQAQRLKIGQENCLNTSVTVYNNNIGLVKDTRRAQIDTGVHHIYFTGIADRIIPASVQIKSLSDSGKFNVYEQNYEYDLLTRDTLLDKFIGRKVKLFFKSELNGTEEIKEAVLLKNEPDPVFQIGNEIYLGYPGKIILPEIPPDLVTEPALLWLVDNKEEKPQELQVSYLTEEISWTCNYVINLSENENKMDILGWVTINNNCGASFKAATLKLVAGDVNRVSDTAFAPKRAYMMEQALAAPAPPEIKEESLFEYHAYTIKNPTDLNNNQSKQISLFEAQDVDVEKKFTVTGQRYFFSSSYSDAIQNIPVNITLEFSNAVKNKLGIPLPAGTVRLYKEDADKSFQFAGENKIGHIPPDETVEISFGSAFDIKTERKQTHFRKIRADLYETGWEIKVKNQKVSDITVTIKENIPGDWKINESNLDYEKISSSIVAFKVPVKTKSETVLKYSVEIKY